MKNLLDNLKILLQKDEHLVSEGNILKNKAIELALKLDKELIKLLLSHEKIKEVFFVDVEGARWFRWGISRPILVGIVVLLVYRFLMSGIIN